MEQSKEGRVASPTISEEISAVYGAIEGYRAKVDKAYSQFNKTGFISRLANWSTFCLLAFIVCVYLALQFLPPAIWGDSKENIRLSLQLLVLLIYVLAAIVALLQFFSIKNMFKDVSGQLFQYAADSSKHEAELFNALDEFSISSIKYVADCLDQAAMRIGQVRAFLLGAIEKIGIVPGLITTFVAISTIAKNHDTSWIEGLSVSVVGFYILMFPLVSVSIKIKRTSYVLNQYLQLFRSRREQEE